VPRARDEEVDMSHAPYRHWVIRFVGLGVIALVAALVVQSFAPARDAEAKRAAQGAFEKLRPAVGAGFNERWKIEGDSALETLRSDARYEELLKTL
jgi:hypothetical protein